MKILIHTCCAPCTVYPVTFLRAQHFEVTGFFYRSNIHPFTECEKRANTLAAYAQQIQLPMIYQQEYDLEGFIRKAAFHETKRCAICYQDRLSATAALAKSGNFDYFTSTLLYSKFQNHGQIQEIGNAIAATMGVPFYYHDFREGWKYGVDISKQLQMYRQQYCGCIYSEKERFYKKR